MKNYIITSSTPIERFELQANNEYYLDLAKSAESEIFNDMIAFRMQRLFSDNISLRLNAGEEIFFKDVAYSIEIDLFLYKLINELGHEYSSTDIEFLREHLANIVLLDAVLVSQNQIVIHY